MAEQAFTRQYYRKFRTNPFDGLQHSCRPIRETVLGDVFGALGLVAAEAGVCIVPATVRRMRSDDVRYVPLDEDMAFADIYLTTAKGWNSPILQHTRDELDRLIAVHEKG